MMKAVDAMRRCFKDVKDKENIIKVLETLNQHIPTQQKSSQLKKLQALKADGLIDDNVYKAAIAKIRASQNGFDDETLAKLKYYKNVISTLIKALR